MRILLTVSALLLLISGNVLAGSGYDKCIKEEKLLKRQETSDCSGLSYLLNPSACFKTQKELKEFVLSGKCKRIGIAENVDFGDPPVLPEKKAGSPGNAAGTDAANKSEPEVPQQENICEQLKDENRRLKTEIGRLKEENELLRNR